jgi:hypothetical protein
MQKDSNQEILNLTVAVTWNIKLWSLMSYFAYAPLYHNGGAVSIGVSK